MKKALMWICIVSGLLLSVAMCGRFLGRLWVLMAAPWSQQAVAVVHRKNMDDLLGMLGIWIILVTLASAVVLPIIAIKNRRKKEVEK